MVTLGIPRSLNIAAQRKIAAVIMTLPLPETKDQTFNPQALRVLKKYLPKYQAVALGPGLSDHPQTKKFILKIIPSIKQPLVIDADGLNAIAQDPALLTRHKSVKVLTPHPGEMSRLTGWTKERIEQDRTKTARDFARKYQCVLLLKGHRTVVAGPDGKVYINKTGNAGMATAGSGDVLTGMIAALLGQGLDGFTAAKYGAYLHGKAGDLAARAKSRPSLIATDIIDFIGPAIKSTSKKARRAS